MRRSAIAVVVSLSVHVLVAAALWAYIEYSPHPEVQVTLDLSSVELSFSEVVEESAPAVVPEPVPAEVPPPPKKAETPPPPKPPEEPPPVAPAVKDDVEVPPPPKKVDEPKQVEKPKPTPPPTPTVRPPAPKQARIDAPPRPKRTIRPEYPRLSRQRGEQGDVVVEMLVNVRGTVDSAKVVTSSGFAELDEAALKAVLAAKFSPAKSGRGPVAATARLRLSFKLTK